jgi:hypothetical protein
MVFNLLCPFYSGMGADHDQKKEFDRLLAESEQAFQAYIFCPSEENEERYQTLKYQYREQMLESDLRLIIEWSK